MPTEALAAPRWRAASASRWRARRPARRHRSSPGLRVDATGRARGPRAALRPDRPHGARPTSPARSWRTLVERARRLCWVSNTLAKPPAVEYRTHGGPMSERLIVIGGGGAGTAAATIAKRVNPDLKVTLFTEFPDIAYSPCGIPFVHGREIPRVRGPLPLDRRALRRGRARHADGDGGHRHRPRPRHRSPRATSTRASTSSIVCTGFVWEKPDVPGANLEGLHYVKNIRAAMEFDKVLDDDEARRRRRRDAARRRDGGQPRPPRPRGATSSTRARGCSREVLDPDVAEPVHESLEQARRDAAPGDRGRGLRRATAACARSRPRAGELAVRRRDRLPAQGAQHARSPRPPGSRPARPAGSWSTTTCARRSPTCGRRATSSRCRTG